MPSHRCNWDFWRWRKEISPGRSKFSAKHRASGDARIFAALASAYLNEQQFDQARAILNEGLAKWPDSSDLLEQLARTEALAGHYDLALSQFQKRCWPPIRSRSRCGGSLAEVCDLEGDHSRAIAYYRASSCAGRR